MVWGLEINELKKFTECSFLHKLETVTHCMFGHYALILQARDNVQYLVAEGTRDLIIALHKGEPFCFGKLIPWALAHSSNTWWTYSCSWTLLDTF